MLAIDIRPDLKGLQRAFIGLRAKQAPFATALALNNLAKGVMVQEQALIGETFDSPTPFTQKAYRMEVATKSRPIAIVAAKDIQAAYLAPYVEGGDRYLGSKKGMLVPKRGNVPVNRYGNLARGKIASLKANPKTFVGRLRTKDGRLVSGVWQGYNGARRKAGGPATGMKLLIVFEDTTPAPKHLNFFGRAQVYVKANAAREFDAAMRRAFATAR